MRAVLSFVFCFVVVFLLVYNAHLFPSIANNRMMSLAVKTGAVVFAVVCARLVFRPGQNEQACE